MRLGAVLVCLALMSCPPLPPNKDGGTGGGTGSTGGGPAGGPGGGTGGGSAGGGSAGGVGGGLPLLVCTDVDAGPAPDAGVIVPITGPAWDGGYDTFCAYYAARYCDYQLQCDTIVPGARADCVTLYTRYFCGVTVDEVSKGMLTFDRQAAGNCLASIPADGGCFDRGCADFVRGAAAPGAQCLEPYNCTNDTVCSGSSACAMTCRDAGALGEPCRYDGCDSNLFCDVDVCHPVGGVDAGCTDGFSFGNQPECDRQVAYCNTDAGRCAALPGAGQQCAPGSVCASGLWCDFIGSNPPICRPYTSLGQSCASSSQCPPEAFCSTTCRLKGDAGVTCLTNSGCQAGLNCVRGACFVPLPRGSTCGADLECQLGSQCDDVLRVCEPTSLSTFGQSCTNDRRTCSGADLRCEGAKVNLDGGVGCIGTCVQRAVGDRCSQFDCPRSAFCTDAGFCDASDGGNPCTRDAQCTDDSYCSTTARRCMPRVAYGQPCTGSACQAPWGCYSGICSGQGRTDAGCTSQFECQIPQACVNGSCQTAGHFGEPCVYSFYCIDGACEYDGGLGRCVALRDAGATCLQGLDCASAYCNRSVCADRCP